MAEETVAEVDEFPPCDFHTFTTEKCPEDATYDFVTKYDVWAYGCETHYQRHRKFSELGTGKGQKLQVRIK